MQHFKIKLKHKYSTRHLWIPVEASSMGEAIVKADNLCFEKPFELSSDLYAFLQISAAEYKLMMKSASWHGTLKTLN